MNRRSFIKGLIALASAPAIGKYVNVFKTEGARKGIENVASQGVDFFNMVIKKVMDEGTLVKEEDRISTFKHPDRPDITVDVDQTTGSSSVYFDTDEGTKAVGEIQKTMDEGTAGRTVEELFEQEEIYGPMGREAQEGISGGITNLEKFLKGKKGFAAGGRVGMFRGGIPKGLQAAMRAIMSKYGDDAITTADRAPQPEKTIQEQIRDFNARTKSKVTEYDPEGRAQFEKDVEEAGGMEEFLDANPIREMAPQMVERLELKARYPGITDDLLDSILIDDNPQRKAEVLATLDEAFAMMRKGKGPDELLRIIKDMNRTKQADGGSIDGDVSLTVIKIPDISESGVESLFKRR